MFEMWRKKLGVGASVLATLLTVCWFRSQFAGDRISVTTGPHSQKALVSQNGSLAWIGYQYPRANGDLPGIPIWDLTYPKDSSDITDTETVEWNWRYKRFGSAKMVNPDGSSVALWVAPYWAFALPTILAAAWLLCREPKAAKDPRPGVPIISGDTPELK